MKTKSLVLILISLGFGLVAAIGMSQVMGRNNGGGVQPETRAVLVALTDLDINQELTSDNVKIEQWPVGVIPEGVIGSWEEAENKRVLERVIKGYPIRGGMLIDKNAVPARGIPDGYNVVPIKVSQEESFHGLLRPGDRVDVIVTKKQGGAGAETKSKRFLKNVRVYAVNDRTRRDLVAEEGGQGSIKTVQVLLTERQAEQLVHAKMIGDLTLVMRSDTQEDEQPLAGLDGPGDGVTTGDLFGEGGSKGPSQVTAGVLSFLNKMQQQRAQAQSARPAKTESHVMRVITPEGVVSYSWTDRNSLPQQVGMSTSMQPAPMDPPARSDYGDRRGNSAQDGPGNRDEPAYESEEDNFTTEE